MCGIAGLFHPSGAFDADEAERALEAASRSMAYRGPDASKVVSCLEDGLSLAHRRLSILDLDRRSDQPMASADGFLRIVFNGEIYNFKELREELRAEGACFRTESDTEVLLEGYARWGLEKLLPKLAGMFAFALFDHRTKTLHLARDRAGKKPLFYRDAGGTFAFASEMRALLALLPSRPGLDPEGLDAFLTLKFVPSPATLVQGVLKLPPGHLLSKRGSEPAKVERWWQPLGGKACASPEAALERTRELLATAVRRRLVSDVPVCLFLSGGIDSSLIASFLAESGSQGMAAYSIGYDDLPAYSEYPYARMVAERFKLDYRKVELGSKEVSRLLEDDTLVLDEPISDWVWVPLYQLSRRAHEDGFKVVLVGEGADELFFGYDVMQDGLEDLARARNPLWRAAAALGSAALGPVYRHASRGHIRYDFLRRLAAGEPAYLGSSVGFPRSLRPQVAGPELKERSKGDPALSFLLGLYALHAGSPQAGDDGALVSLVEFYAKMGEVLLQRVDRVSMLHSLEARAPFLDHELVEHAFALPQAWKLPDGRLKGHLRDLAAGRLPKEIVSRPKMGFSFPFKEWLRGGLGSVVERAFESSRLFQDGWVSGEFCRDLLAEHRSRLVDHAPRVWTLYSLSRWYDRWMA
ncbi:MAG TPA: asparagine synthase (glutamine-hydrolyzing) [Elusimicrobia bacterium]|nr:asparagine synthase (glutamine-hydrolyzing) [Elusimicrobiota bacterium]